MTTNINAIPSLKRLVMDAAETHQTSFYEAILKYPIPAEPTRLPLERKRFRNKFLIEEQMEFRDADTLDEEADALVDLIIVAIGGLLEMGISPRAGLGEVFDKNANKVSGKKPGRDSEGFDAMKPEGWVGPDYEALMAVGIEDIRDALQAKQLRAEVEALRASQATEAVEAETTDTGQAMKFNSHKENTPELIPAPALIALGKLYAAGAHKYDAENWRKGRPWQDLIGSAERHFLDWRCGETLDVESNAVPKTHNLIAAAWNLITLYMYERNGLGTDNRPDVGDLA